MENRKINEDVKEKILEKVPEDVFNNFGPKTLFRMEAFSDMSGGWRAGHTKPTVESRKEKNRMKNKVARKSRRINRGK